MSRYFLAIDIGASSGRHILGSVENGKIVLEEVYRFWNGMDHVDGTLCWDVDRLFNEIIAGMKKCKEIGKIPVGIDTWGVDFVLLDKEDNIVGQTVGYRDHRTEGMDEEVYKIISEDDLYARTGIQKAIYNTIYQLMAVKKTHPEYLEKADAMLMIPDYFHFKLSGKKVQEYSEATTSQLINPVTKDWDYELIDMLGFPRGIFQKVLMPGTTIGSLTDEVKELVGYDCKVVLPPTHDTASAVMAIPTNAEDTCYISSGTWSLMGVEMAEANCTPKSKEANFTNEGGYDHRFRYLKNIMGLWMIQSVRKELAPKQGFGEICEAAARADIASLVDCNDDRFLAPQSMTEEVQKACAETGQRIPEGIAETACVIYNSLAQCYAQTIREIEEMSEITYESIHVVGGGANAAYLNELTAKATGKTVYAGPTEATAIGNLTAQIIAAGELENLQAARKCIFESFEIKKYEK